MASTMEFYSIPFLSKYRIGALNLGKECRIDMNKMGIIKIAPSQKEENPVLERLDITLERAFVLSWFRIILFGVQVQEVGIRFGL